MRQQLFPRTLNIENHSQSYCKPYDQKQNIRYSTNNNQLQFESTSRYPQIETKVQRLLLKIDYLVAENMRLHQLLNDQKQIRINQQLQFRVQIQSYQKHQQQIQQFISELEHKLLKASRKGENRSNSKGQTNYQADFQFHQKYQTFIQDQQKITSELILKYQLKIQEALEKVKIKDSQLSKTKQNLRESNQKIQQFDSKISQLKEIINEINQINEDLVSENQNLQTFIKQKDLQIQMYSQKEIAFQNTYSTVQKLFEKKCVHKQCKEQRMKILEAEVLSQYEDIQDLLVGIQRLELKLQKAYTYTDLLEQQNGSLNERTWLQNR